ncbi:S24 family peptidase [uncultured Acinetobacter sp.]|uniref:LexA family protein n=1 Tax=uncultured Acinetobacter sp. TaxID=165433 RepID=UPI00262F1618|nr:S24 family peptidase [uncultured Acinetobacter sp.]
MQQTVSDRIRLRMSELNISQADLVRFTGASRGTVSGWFNGTNSPSAKHLDSVCRALKTNAQWLLAGSSTQNYQNELTFENFDNVKPCKTPLRVIPVLDFVQAGLWREVVYDGVNPKGETCTTYQGTDPKAIFSLIIDGMSMAPEFMPGDQIIVDAAKKPVPGSLVVAQELQHGSALTTFKKYRVIGVNEHGVDIVELVPLNSDFPTYNSLQIEISIIGVVVQHHREFKY